MKLSIVVPCYNEGENVTKVLAAYDAVIKRTDIEVLLVNNGSTDETPHVLERLFLNLDHLPPIPSVNARCGSLLSKRCWKVPPPCMRSIE